MKKMIEEGSREGADFFFFFFFFYIYCRCKGGW